jgi:exosortase A-associated hydrolase 1
MTEYKEKGLVFRCADNRLVGVAAIPETEAHVGVLIMVGGPQYRAGSHRQFTLLARSLASAGIPSLRFDYAGMGDSEGDRLGFEKIDLDVAAAIGIFQDSVPGMSHVILWGLCDAASSAMMLAHRDVRIKGMVLLNPWVHSGEYSPAVKLSHFYRPLFTQKDQWRRLLSGKIALLPALKELAQDTLSLVGKYLSRRKSAQTQKFFVDEMLDGLQRFKDDVLLILSSNDLTAKEFSTLADSDPIWQAAMHKPGVEVHSIDGADHTFSQRRAQDLVAELTIQWVKRL